MSHGNRFIGTTSRGAKSVFGGRSIVVPVILLLCATSFLFIGCGKEGTTDPVDNGSAADTIPPATVIDLTVGTIGTTSVSLMWSAPGDDDTDGTASSYDLRYHTETITDANWESAVHVNGVRSPKEAGQREIFTVTNLACTTGYFFALKTQDEVPNTSGLSNCPYGITRQERVPPTVVSDLTATAISDTEFLLEWTAPGDDGLAGTASEYDIRYSKFYIELEDWESASQVIGEPSPKPGGEADSFVVSGLDPGDNYYFAMKSSDEVPNESGMSNCCVAMAYSELLMVSPLSFTIGDVEHLTIVFRAQAGVRVTIKVWGHEPGYQWRVFQNVANGFFTEGVHTILWDLWSDLHSKYVDEDQYKVDLLYDNVLITTKDFRVSEP
jgi:hypothetical protein